MKPIAPTWNWISRFAARRRRPSHGGIVVFAPNAWFPSMLAAPAIIGKTLAERGHQVDVVSCAGERQTCTVMDGMAPTEERPIRRFCEDCVPQSRDYLARYGLNQMFDTDFLSGADRQRLADATMSIGPDPRTFVWDGIHIGTLAAGNLSAITKRDIFSALSEDHCVRLRLMVEDGLRWYVIANNIFARLKPEHLIYYAEYYPEVIVGTVMQRLGVRVVPVTHSGLNGNDFRKVQIIDHMPQVLEMSRRMQTWPGWRELPLSPSQVDEISDDVVTKLLGNSPICFSPSLNQGSELGEILRRLRPDLKTIVVFTSSDDELNNTKIQREIFELPVDTSGEIFPDQCAWLREVADFVADSDEHQMIVRLHPRLAANKRSSAVAEYTSQVDAVTAIACPRVHVVLPESQCSSYDLAQQADLVLTSWSSMGLECVRLGLPVMMAFRGTGILPTDGFLNFCDQRETYFRRLRDGISIEIKDVLEALRYTNMLLCATAIDLSDLVPSFNDPRLPPYSTPRCADEIEQCVVGEGSIHRNRLAEQRAAQTASSAQEERAALARAIRRIIHTLVFGEDVTPAGLIVSDDARASASEARQDDWLYLSINEPYVDLAYGDKHASRLSRSIRTLASFHQSIEAPDTAARSAA